MISFFDVFKWDRFVSTSIIELLFWLLSAMSVLVGAYGLFEGLQFLGSNPITGLMVITLSIIGGLTGVVGARVLCEAVVIMFRMNDNLIDIRDNGLNAMAQAAPEAVPVVDEQDDLERVMLERKLAESRQQAARRIEARNAETRHIEPQPEPRALSARLPEAPAMEPRGSEVRYAEPRIPEARAAEARVPRSWDVRAPEPRKAPEPHAWETRGHEPGSQERVREQRAASLRAPEPRFTEPRAPEPRAPETRLPESRPPEVRQPETRAPERRVPDLKAQEPQAADLRPIPEARERVDYRSVEPKRFEAPRSSAVPSAEMRMAPPLLRPSLAEAPVPKPATLDIVPEPVVVEPDPLLKADALVAAPIVEAIASPEVVVQPVVVPVVQPPVEPIAPPVAFDAAPVVSEAPVAAPGPMVALQPAEAAVAAAVESLSALNEGVVAAASPAPKSEPRAGRGGRGKSNGKAAKNAAPESANIPEPAATTEQPKAGDAA